VGSFNNVEPSDTGLIVGAVFVSCISPAEVEPPPLETSGKGSPIILAAVAAFASTAATPDKIAGIFAGNGKPAPLATAAATPLAVSIAISAKAIFRLFFSALIKRCSSALVNLSPAACLSLIRLISLSFASELIEPTISTTDCAESKVLSAIS